MGRQLSVLVAYASSDVSTWGVAESIAAPLRQPGAWVGLRPGVATRAYRVFFGPLDLNKLGTTERSVTKMPSRALLSEDDLSDQPDVHTWATEITQALEPARAVPP